MDVSLVFDENIICDMNALPQNKGMQDKYYIGYYDDCSNGFNNGFP